VFFFPLYAVLVWYAAARWRRRWESFAWVGAGVAGLVLIAYLHLCLNEWTHGRIFLRVLQTLLYPYTGLVGVVGVYIACLPRRVAVYCCHECHYDLSGLIGETAVCPECGTTCRPEVRPRPIPGPGAAPSPKGAPLQAGPRWPAIGAPAACHHSADG